MSENLERCFAEQNFRATIGRENDSRDFKMTRRVNWAHKHEGCHETDSYDVEEEHINRVHAHSFEPTYVTVSQQDERLKKIESILSKLD